MSTIKERLIAIKKTLPEHVTLVAVSKYHPIAQLQEAYDAGQRIFGESREQEVKVKHEVLPKDIEWHFIGHLQTNKVKYIAPFVALIHSVDTDRLLDEINKQAIKNGRTIDVLLQVHIAQEESKSGFLPDELIQLLSTEDIANRWPNVRLRGLMGMATFTDNAETIHHEFQALVQLNNALLNGPLKQHGIGQSQFDTLSFGMSEDYEIAIAEGSNMVRIGTAIFGERDYSQPMQL